MRLTITIDDNDLIDMATTNGRMQARRDVDEMSRYAAPEPSHGYPSEVKAEKPLRKRRSESRRAKRVSNRAQTRAQQRVRKARKTKAATV